MKLYNYLLSPSPNSKLYIFQLSAYPGGSLHLGVIAGSDKINKIKIKKKVKCKDNSNCITG